MTAVSIVIPAYNEEEAIGSVIDQVISVMEEAGIINEIIVVDDGSTDETYEIAKSAEVKVIRHPYNIGNGAAVKTGIRETSADYVLLMDADGQHDPKDIYEMIDLLQKYDMVIGVRIEGAGGSVVRDIGNSILSSLASYLAGRKIPDLTSGFRAIRRDLALRYLHLLPNGYSYPTTITLVFLLEGYSVGYLPIKATRRVAGSSHLKPFYDGFQFLLIIVRMISLFNPLKVFLPASLVLFLSGFIYLLYTLFIMANMNVPDGSVLLISASVVIFFFGILADQISALRRQRHF